MRPLHAHSLVPPYHGKSWLDVRLPRKTEDWLSGQGKSIAEDVTSRQDLIETLGNLNKNNAWEFPKKRHFFFSDLHGDPEAFCASLVACGGVTKTGKKPQDFILTPRGRKSTFIIGGDTFDKGPSSLELLRTIYTLKKQGARVRILAGNHDVRVLFGMTSVGKEQTVQSEYFFIRTGQKIIPLLTEIWNEYLKGKHGLKGIPSHKECKRLLYPSSDWFDKFSGAAQGHISDPQVNRELTRIRKKYDGFEQKCHDAGLTLRQVYACVQKWKELFLQPGGEFFWFYNRMRLMYKSGSFLFVHAGLDNKTAHDLTRMDIKDINKQFRKALQGNPFDFYYSSLCNSVRTKYRKVDHPFSRKGARYIRQAGFSAIIHGHRNLHNGQRIALRSSVLNFECDTSLDRATRKKEKVRGRGASVTIIEPKGKILGVSSDYPNIKVFDPKKILQKLKKSKQER